MPGSQEGKINKEMNSFIFHFSIFNSPQAFFP